MKFKSKELSTRGSTGQKKSMKERKMGKHGKTEDGSMARNTTEEETGMAKTATKRMMKKDGKNMRTRKTEVSGMKQRKMNGEALSAVPDGVFQSTGSGRRDLWDAW